MGVNVTSPDHVMDGGGTAPPDERVVHDSGSFLVPDISRGGPDPMFVSEYALVSTLHDILIPCELG